MPRLRSLVIILAATLISACSEPSDTEAEIRATIAQMQAALEERDNSGFREHLAASFLGGQGGQRNMDREAARRLLAAYFIRYRNIDVVITSLDIDPDPHEPALASMRGSAALSGGSTALPENARLYRFEGQWRYLKGRWQLIQFSWE